MVMEKARSKEKAERAALRKTMNQKRAAVRIQYPFNSWSKFLQYQANQGNETALAILRSKKEKALSERHVTTTHSPALATASNVTLTSVAKMRELFKLEGIKTEPQYTIDSKGTIIFKLPNGASIRDTGSEIHFTIHNEQAKCIATKLAKDRWGQSVSIEGSILKNPSPMLMLQPQTQKYFDGLGR
jgi:hypothetical protein